MRQILFRGKNKETGDWLFGHYSRNTLHTWPLTDVIYPSHDAEAGYLHYEEIDGKTLGQYTGLNDKNGKPIFEGDVVQYNDIMDFDIQSIVCFGEYGQDGSSGEYNPRRCIGWFVRVDNFTCPDYLESSDFPEYKGEQNLLEVAADCIVIGNIHDNPELITDRKGD